MHKSKHLALERTALLAAVPLPEIAGLLPVTTALVDMAGDAVQSTITAEEPVGDALAAALGRHAVPRLKEASVRGASIPEFIGMLTMTSPITMGRAATRERMMEYWTPSQRDLPRKSVFRFTFMVAVSWKSVLV